jgi:hypothetical protein
MPPRSATVEDKPTVGFTKLQAFESLLKRRRGRHRELHHGSSPEYRGYRRGACRRELVGSADVLLTCANEAETMNGLKTRLGT